MGKREYEIFKNSYLTRFIKTYRVKGINKKELKRSVFNNKHLSQDQKEDFWQLVTA